MTQPKLNIYGSVDEVISGIADYFVQIADESIARDQAFNVSLSGGSSPKKLYELLASADYQSKVDWTKVFFFFGDERYVSADSKDSNFRMVKEALFNPLQIEPKQIFAVDTTIEPASAAAKDYQTQIEQHFQNKQIEFDLILLGLGDNSHTASLFPHTPVLHDQEAEIKAVYLQDQDVYRITKTAKMINQAHHIAFLLYGEGKAEAVHHVLEDNKNIEEYPAQLIKPEHGDVSWFLDKPAAALLKNTR